MKLSRQSHESSEILEVLYSYFEEGVRQPTVEVLTKALLGLLGPSEETSVVLDPLDEGADIPGGVSFLEDMRGWHSMNLHILITSRKEYGHREGTSNAFCG